MSCHVLVSCVNRKLSRPAPAMDLYASPLFRLSVAYARTAYPRCSLWILSALHGLVRPRTVVAPYNYTLAGAKKAVRQAWGVMVVAQITAEGVLPCDLVVLLAGEAYCAPLRSALVGAAAEVLEPLRGLTMGRRLAWLKARLEGRG